MSFSTKTLLAVLSPLPRWVKAVRVCPYQGTKTLVLCLCEPGHLPEIHDDLAKRGYPEGCVFGWGDTGNRVPEGIWLDLKGVQWESY